MTYSLAVDFGLYGVVKDSSFAIVESFFPCGYLVDLGQSLERLGVDRA